MSADLSREELLELYARRLRENQPRDHITWPTCDRPLSPAETAYLVPELPEEEQCAPTPP